MRSTACASTVVAGQPETTSCAAPVVAPQLALVVSAAPVVSRTQHHFQISSAAEERTKAERAQLENLQLLRKLERRLDDLGKGALPRADSEAPALPEAAPPPPPPPPSTYSVGGGRAVTPASSSRRTPRAAGAQGTGPHAARRARAGGKPSPAPDHLLA